MNFEEAQTKFFSNGRYVAVNHVLMSNLGTDEAIIYSELFNKALYLNGTNQLTSDGFFFYTVADMEYTCSILEKKQKRILNDLCERGLIEVDYRGLPKRRYIKVILDDEVIEKVFEDKRKKPEHKPVPNGVKEKYSQPFEIDIFQRIVYKSCKQKKHRIEADTIFSLYKRFFDRFGYPSTYLSQNSVDSLLDRFDGLDEEFDIVECFDDYCEEYEKSTENGWYTRSMNNLITYEMLDILQKRLI